MATKINAYQVVTEHILSQLEDGIIPWKQDWVGKAEAMNYVSRAPYKGINTLLLPKPGEYLTFKQIEALKGKVKKGAHGSIVVFFQMVRKETEDKDTGKIKVEEYPVLRYYKVFHLDDTEGIETKIGKEPKEKNSLTPEAAVTEYMMREGVDLDNSMEPGSERVVYNPNEDIVETMAPNMYDSPNDYYAALFHGMVHSTAKEGRCNRESDSEINQSGSFTREELVAEIGSAMICHKVAVETPNTFDKSMGYIEGWKAALKADYRLIVTASGRAEKAARFILNDEPKDELKRAV